MKKHLPFSFGCLLLSAMMLQTIDGAAQKAFKAYSVRGTMFINEESTRKAFPKLLIFTSVYDPELNKKILQEFEKTQLNAINALKVLSPVKEYSEDERLKIYQEYAFDYVITTEVIDRIADKGILTQEIEVTLFDVEKKNKVAIFVGRAVSTTADQDRGVHKFLRAVVKELQPIIAL